MHRKCIHYNFPCIVFHYWNWPCNVSPPPLQQEKRGRGRQVMGRGKRISLARSPDPALLPPARPCSSTSSCPSAPAPPHPPDICMLWHLNFSPPSLPGSSPALVQPGHAAIVVVVTLSRSWSHSLGWKWSYHQHYQARLEWGHGWAIARG